MIRLEEILDCVEKHHPGDNLELVRRAYILSAKEHKGQVRASGEPYLSHPLEVANILAEMKMDAVTVGVGLLHDVVEDTLVPLEKIEELFGPEVAHIVDGVTKISQIHFTSKEEKQAENFRKMLLAMTDDIRVIMVKFADRLHNMRTLAYLASDRREAIARETLDIYAPIANRLGLNSIYQELEDLSFKHLYPDRYRVLSKAVKAARGNRREALSKVMESVKRRLKDNNVEAQVHGREKHLYSIYRKMREKSLPFAQVLDVFGFRIVGKDVHACYLARGALPGL